MRPVTHSRQRGAGRVAAALVFVLSACAFAQDGPESAAFVEIVSERTAYYAGEPFTVTIRVGIEAQFLEERAVQPFRRELQVPVQIQAPWFDAPAGVRRLAIYGMRAGTGRKLALNDDVTAAYPRDAKEIDGRTFRVFDVDRRFVVAEPGTLAIPAPRLHLAYATRFEESFVEGRVPVDRHDATVDGAGLELTILALPDEGRPAEFAGAVGRFAVRATAEPEAVDVGATVRLTVEVDGSGDWRTVTAPALDDDAFHVQGVIATDRRGGRTFVYDVEVLRPVAAMPAVPFAYFDPGPPAGYRVVRTAPVPLTVRGAADAPPSPGIPPETGTERDAAADTSSPSLVTLLVIGAVVLVLCHFVAFWFLLSRRARAAQAKAASAAHSVTQQVAGGADPADALAAFLAARLGCEPAAVISPDLPDRLSTAGVSMPLAERTSQTLERLVAARYGGTAPDDAAALVGTLVAELEAALRPGA